MRFFKRLFKKKNTYIVRDSVTGQCKCKLRAHDLSQCVDLIKRRWLSGHILVKHLRVEDQQGRGILFIYDITAL